MAIVRTGPGTYQDTATGKVTKGQASLSAATAALQGASTRTTAAPSSFSSATSAAAKALAGGTSGGLYNAITAGIPYGNQLQSELTANKLDTSVDPTLQGALDKSNANVDLLNQGFDPQTQQLLDTEKSGLGGFTAPELNAQLGTGLASILAQSSSDTNSMLGSLGARNLQGGIAAKLGLGIQQTANNSNAALQSDVLSKQAAEQDARAAQYSNTLQGANTNLTSAKSAAFTNLTNLATNAATLVQSAKTTNLNNLNAAISAKYATPFTFGQFYETDQGRKDSANYYTQALAAAQNGVGSGGAKPSSGGSSSPSSSGGNTSSFQNSGLN